MNRTAIRQVNILCEYDYTLGLAEKVYQNQLNLSEENLVLLKNERQEYYDTLNFSSKDVKQAYAVYRKLCDTAINNSYEDLLPKFKAAKNVVIVNFNKEGRCNGVYDKTDIKIYTDDKQINLSLKLYKDDGDTIQVASGTYLSTLFGMCFDSAGSVGSFLAPNGEKFTTRAKNGKINPKAEKAVLATYNQELLSCARQLKELDNDFKPLVKESYCDVKWKAACKKVGYEAVGIFLKAVDIIKQHDESGFTRRSLNRVGIFSDDEIVLVMGKNYFSTFNNTKAKSIVNRASKNNVTIEVCQSGKDKAGKGLSFSVNDSSGKIVSWEIPLTINKNGAWQLSNKEGRFCKKDQAFIPYGEPRPAKSKEIATSTNSWFKVREVFDKENKE